MKRIEGLFDVFLMVDWSASSKPCTGPNSVWYCIADKETSAKTLRNPSTREQAYLEIEEILRKTITERKRCLVGFDFPFGYPAGFAKAMKLTGVPWFQIWKELRSMIKDGPLNKNERFAVAAKINHAVSNGPAPFWGCPKSVKCQHLGSRRPKLSLPEFRYTDKQIKGPQSAWKLFGIGSVGSQALLGIPYLFRLRFETSFSDCIRIWPFETGFHNTEAFVDGAIILVEIYPSWLTDSHLGHPIKDARQVIRMSEKFAELDRFDHLPKFFSPDVPADVSEKVVQEEGWILGSQ